jgi:L-alanine-DL-glutamate epimerase-like enolase superfamily enzyme
MVDHTRLSDPNATYTMRDLSTDTMELSADQSILDAEITDVQTTMVDGNYPWILVRIYTDAGVAGTGESYWGGGDTSVIDRMKPFLLGENPIDIDRLYEHLIQKMSGEGSVSGKVISAISGVEIALHDVAGKLLGVPAYQLLGGKYRDSVRAYCDCHTEEEADPEACAAEAERVVDELGYNAIKFDLDVPSGHERDRANRHLNPLEIEHKVELVEAVTERVRGQAEVAFDCHWTYSADSAKRLARALEKYHIWWLEDPVPPENHDVQRTVTEHSSTPIATGENVYRTHGQRQLIEEEAVDILTPDIPKVGGLREGMKIANLADMYHVPVAMHNVSSPVGTMASAHLGAAIPNFLAVEYHSYQLDWWEDLIEETVIDEGSISVTPEPGLGLTLDLDTVETHMVDGEELFDEA